MRKPAKRSTNDLTNLVNLTQKEVLRLPKPKRGFLEHAQPILELYRSRFPRIVVKGGTPARAFEVLAAYVSLLKLERDLTKQLQNVKKTRGLRGSTLWMTMLDVYALAGVAGRNDLEVARAIGVFARFLKHKPRPKKKARAAQAPITAMKPARS